jgi:hypothetical protein
MDPMRAGNEGTAEGEAMAGARTPTGIRTPGCPSGRPASSRGDVAHTNMLVPSMPPAVACSSETPLAELVLSAFEPRGIDGNAPAW